MALAPVCAGFRLLSLLPIIKLGPSGADSQMGGLVYVLGPCGSLQQLSCEAGSFSCCFNPHRFLKPGVFEALFPGARTLGCVGCLTPLLFHLVYLHTNVGLPGLPLPPCQESSPSGCLSPPLPPVWMNVFSLTPWLLNFQTV